MTGTADTPEFSRLIPIDAIGTDGDTRRAIAATSKECAALAVRLGLEGLQGFRAELTIDRMPAGEIWVHGRVCADVVQTCVVTLEPAPGRFDDSFEVRFTTREEPEVQDLVIGPDEEFPPEPLAGDALDIGELSVQQLALALDPYPRRPDAQIPRELLRDPSRDGPFAALAQLRAKEAGGKG